MSRNHLYSRSSVFALVALMPLALGEAGPARANSIETGPSSSQSPYLLPIAPRTSVTSIISAGDTVPGSAGGTYRMVGIPDGLGAYDNGDGTFTVLMNHELGGGAGAVRAHGATGAFVSKWVIEKSTLKVLSGQDLITTVHTSGSTTLSRLCSADLADPVAFYNAATGKGVQATEARIFMSGEESGTEGRAFAHVATGAEAGHSFDLPYLGKFSWENSVARPVASDKTIVIGTDDGTGGQVYVYVGDKKSSGTIVEKAGLSGGTLFGVAVSGTGAESRGAGIGGASKAFSLATLGDVSGMTGAELETASGLAGVTSFLRPEDGAWDPTNSNRFWFVTTDRFDTVKDPGVSPTLNTPAGQTGASRLWKMTFTFDADGNPTGGTIDLVLDGATQPFQMLDNITVGEDGTIILQEDPGNQAYTARVWRYDPVTGVLSLLLEHDAARFGNQNGLLPTGPYSKDEESSGVIDVTKILGGDGRRYYLMDVQAHYGFGDASIVEGGQLLLVAVPEPSTLGLGGTALLALAGFSAASRRRR